MVNFGDKFETNPIKGSKYQRGTLGAKRRILVVQKYGEKYAGGEEDRFIGGLNFGGKNEVRVGVGVFNPNQPLFPL